MMQAKLVVLGSGTSVPHPTRRPPAFLVQAGSTSLLVDVGAGATTGLAAAGVGLDRLSAVLLSHLHLDHTAELVPLLFALRNPVGPRRSRDLPLWGPKKLKRQLRGLRRLYGDWVDPLAVALRRHRLRDRQGFSVGPVKIRPFAVAHAGESYAFRLAAGERTICVSGDSGVCDALVEAAAGVDLLVCECGALESERTTKHLSPTEMGQLAARAGCARVVLTHLYQRVLDSDPLPRVRAHFDGEVHLGFDGMTWVAGGGG
jgi:ribonuclease BN (tRNA processing enzyme)